MSGRKIGREFHIHALALLLAGLMVLAAEEAQPGVLALLVKELKESPFGRSRSTLNGTPITQFQRDARA